MKSQSKPTGVASTTENNNISNGSILNKYTEVKKHENMNITEIVLIDRTHEVKWNPGIDVKL